MTTQTGWVSVGIDHDTAQWAVASIRRWWVHRGQTLAPQAGTFLMTADGGGSQASRTRLWKVERQGLADETGLRLHGCHFPPGTSTWHNIAQRMCCHITETWRGRPLIDHAVIVQRLGHPTTTTGLALQAELDRHVSPIGMAIADQEMQALHLSRAKFHGEDWHYIIKPRK